MPAPIDYSSALIDLSQRFQGSSDRRRVTCGGCGDDHRLRDDCRLRQPDRRFGVRLHGFAAFTVGTNGVSANLRIRETNVAGAVVQATGAVIAVATNLLAMNVLGFDATPGVSVYVLTLTVGSGSAPSTVSAVHLSATVI
jgi:hypothetical protein